MCLYLIFFLFNDPSTSEIYTLSLHDALPICDNVFVGTSTGSNSLGSNNIFLGSHAGASEAGSNKLYISNSSTSTQVWEIRDRKSTRLNSSHQIISYAVFCLKKKKKNIKTANT